MLPEGVDRADRWGVRPTGMLCHPREATTSPALRRPARFPNPWLPVALAVSLVCSALAAADGKPAMELGKLSGISRVSSDGGFRSWYEGEKNDQLVVEWTNNVEVTTGDARVLCDTLTYREALETVTAAGNVVLSFPGASLAGQLLTYNVKTQTGTIDQVVGYLTQDNATIRADRVERVSPQVLRVTHALFTTCTQPVPYWSFYIGDGRFELGRYAYMKNVSFRVGHAPIFYSPYMVYPIKTGRASGLLFPEFGTSDKLGRSLNIPFYWAALDNADLTVNTTLHSRVGVQIGTTLDWLPTWNGRTWASFDWINDRIRKQNRWKFEWKGRQPLEHGFRAVARVQAVSDFDYFTDYETKLQLAALPQTDSTIDITRHWSWYALSFRARRQEQFFATTGSLGLSSFLTGKVENVKLPEIELRGRSQRLGRSPFYFSLRTSLDRFGKRIFEPPDGSFAVRQEDDLATVANNRWWRADLAPALRVPLVKAAWADLELNFSWRGTYYTAQRAPNPTRDPELVNAILPQGLTRSLYSAGVSFAGPRLQRVFVTPAWEFTPKLKHVIEPFAEYRYRPGTRRLVDQIIRVDQVDDDPSSLSDFSFGIRQRLFALRSADVGPATGLASARETSFDALEKQSEEAQSRARKQEELAALGAGRDTSEPAPEKETPLAPVEIASFEISQAYSLSRTLSDLFAIRVDESGDPIIGVGGRPETVTIGRRHYSPVRLKLRFNPTQEQTVDVSYVVDPANSKLTETSISALMRLTPLSYLSGSWYRRRPANVALSDPTSFLRLQWGWLNREQSFGLETEWDYDLEAGSLDHQSYRLRYSTQCCAFRFGWDRRDFVENSRQEYSLVVDLSGLGKLIDLKQAR